MAKKSPCLVQFKILKDRITPTGATSSNRNRSSSGTGKGGKTKEEVEQRYVQKLILKISGKVVCVCARENVVMYEGGAVVCARVACEEVVK
jgi:hypothetical protein